MSRFRFTSSTASNCRGRSNRSISMSSCSRTRSRKWCTSTRSRPSFRPAPSRCRPRKTTAKLDPRQRTGAGGRRHRIGGPDRVTGKAAATADAVASRMPELPNGRDRALLVEVDFGAGEPEERLAELKALAASAGAEVADIVTARRARPDPALFAGRGKIEEIGARRAAADADLVIFDHALSGAQQRNLERALQCRVVDRVSLILDIFAQRAQSAEGKLQVELAQLQ